MKTLIEKEFKGTQGKWILNEKYQTIEDSEGNGIAQQNGIKNSKNWLNDALLISEAPNLLQVLRDLVWLYDNHALDEELSENINFRAKKVIQRILQ